MWELGRGVGSPSSLKGAWPALCTLLWLVLALLTPLFYLGSLSTAFRLPLHPHCTLKCWVPGPCLFQLSLCGLPSEFCHLLLRFLPNWRRVTASDRPQVHIPSRVSEEPPVCK